MNHLGELWSASQAHHIPDEVGKGSESKRLVV